jgi:hypothetical protein
LPFAVQASPSRSDKLIVGAFLSDAEAILDAARAASGALSEPSNFTILIGPNGGIHMLADSDWPLASLEAQHGARTLYRVSRTRGRVAVEGRSGNERCRLESEPPRSVARRLLAGPVTPLFPNA